MLSRTSSECLTSGVSRVQRGFLPSEDGAVTTDFVVITAFVIAISVAVMSSIGGGLEDTTGDIAADLQDMQPQPSEERP